MSPRNGLDPAGMIEMRELRLPDEYGVTVFLSSHLLGEVEQIATHVGIIGCGQLLFEGTLEAFQRRSGNRVVIETDNPTDAIRDPPSGRLESPESWRFSPENRISQS
jgi:ABC-2 type transport system ATP-binding protein